MNLAWNAFSFTRPVVLASAALLVIGSGCATNKGVRAKIAPLENRIGDAEKKSAQQGADINQLANQNSRTEELAMSADKQAKDANELAKQAGSKAGEAGQKATSAQALAEQGITKVATVEKSIDRMYENLDNYNMIAQDSVLFGFDRSELNAEAKSKLDGFADKIKAQKKYVIEVQGFTDPSGGNSYNLELSRRRATAVVRYLTLNHNVPLRRIQMLGVGSEAPSADNKTRAGRQQNRRVEVKVYALPERTADLVGSGSEATGPSSNQ
jgi:outer membrane protein OmpA-like peptidoglycan-associated protein